MSWRAGRKVNLEKYNSPENVARAVKDLCAYETTYVDPCAGKNNLYDVLPEPKQRYDITEGTDFLGTQRDTFGGLHHYSSLAKTPHAQAPTDTHAIMRRLHRELQTSRRFLHAQMGRPAKNR